MSLRDQYKNAAQQQQDKEAEERRQAFFAYTPAGMAQRIDRELGQIADKVEADIAARIGRLASGKKATGPITYRIEKISNLPEKHMKSVAGMKGFEALREVCGRPGNDVRVDVVLHHGCLNGGVDVRVYPDEPFKASQLSIDGLRVNIPKEKKTAPTAIAREGQIAVMRPLVLTRK